MSKHSEVQTFNIEVPQAELGDRLSYTRWTDEVKGAGSDYGTNLGSLVQAFFRDFR